MKHEIKGRQLRDRAENRRIHLLNRPLQDGSHGLDLKLKPLEGLFSVALKQLHLPNLTLRKR